MISPLCNQRTVNSFSCNVRNTLVLGVVLGWIQVFPAAQMSAAPIEVGDRLQLFLDEQLIESKQHLELKLHEPRRAEICIQKDRPWEDSTLYDPVVMLDEGLYRMWYRADFNTPPFYTGYAESQDGVHWHKPILGLFEFEGSKDNNIVWVGNHHVAGGNPSTLSIFKDLKPGVSAEERYKATGVAHGGGLQGMVSPDGLRWKLLQQKPVVPPVGAFDSHNITLWDASRQHYVSYTRGWKDGIRRIRRAVTHDFSQFPAPEFIDIQNPPGAEIEHLYKNATTPYFRNPEILLMFPKRFHPTRKFFPEWKPSGQSDIVFMFSRDGIRWDRRFREAFMRPGPDPLNWHERAIEMGPGLVPTGAGEMSLYFVEHYRTDSVRIRRAVLRTDGLTSVHAGWREGEFLTPPLIFNGDRLAINYATSAVGSVRVELQNHTQQPLANCSLEDCIEIFGDETQRIVAWKQNADIGRFAGQSIRLRVVMREADLFSMRFLANSP